MSNTYINSILKGLDTEILEQLQPELQILQGDILALSTYGKTMWSEGLSWASYGLTANFMREQDSPFTPSAYGTVQIIEQPVPNLVPIYTHACKVSFNHAYFERAKENGTIMDLYREQFTAKIIAWDELCSDILMFGSQETRQNGLFQGSGIPMITSTVNMSSAAPEAVITEFTRLAAFTTNATKNLFKPNLIGIPQNLYNILSVRPYSTLDSTSILEVILRRLKTTAGYEKPGSPVFKITPTHQFDANKVMTVLPDNPNLIGGAVWPLKPFSSNDNSESYKDGEQMLASSHEGGTAGIIAKRPTSGLIVNLTY